MILTRMALPRRSFLRGMGAALALPVLDAMLPAMATATQAASLVPRRLGFVYLPMGANIAEWTPRQEGRLTELSPILASLMPVLNQITVVSNLELKDAYSAGNHASANAAFLSGVLAKPTEGADYELATTIDQIAARQLGQATPLPSLELATDFNYVVGSCDNGLSCVYINTLSWSSSTTPVPTEANPRVVFERLFGDGATAAERRAEERKNRSILDWVTDDWSRLQRRLGPADRTRVNEYLDAVREVERRIAAAGQRNTDALPDATRPVGVPAEWEAHCRLMFDLQVLALQADITRVVTFQLARELSTRNYPQIGVNEAHHPVSHHMDNPVQLAKLTKINAYHVSLFADFLQKLAATPDGDGTLLDHSTYLLGSGMGNPNAHDHSNLPVLVAGTGGGSGRGGRHIKYAKPTPLTNLLITLLAKNGVNLEKFADSTGRVSELIEPRLDL